MATLIKDSDASILYRCNQKYFDSKINKYGLGYSNLIFLLEIYENEGVSLNELAIQGAFDKGTITKSIQKLEQLNYVNTEVNIEDKRSKLLYTTTKANEIIPSLYQLKKEWEEYLSKDISMEEMNMYENTLAKLINKARSYSMHEESNTIKIYEFNKLSLNDYKDKVCAVVYTGGCNFKCPYCDKKDLIFLNNDNNEIDINTIYEYLDNKHNILDGVTISGGEPLIAKGIKDFIKTLKSKNYFVKLNTNGSNSEILKELIDEKLLDYVSLDIKNTKDKYAYTIGLDTYETNNIDECLKLLKKANIDYELNITLVKEFHEDTDFNELGKWLKGHKLLILNNFKDNGNCLKEGLHPLDNEELLKIKETLAKYIEEVIIKE